MGNKPGVATQPCALLSALQKKTRNLLFYALLSPLFQNANALFMCLPVRAGVWLAGVRWLLPILRHGQIHRDCAHALRLQAVVSGTAIDERHSKAAAAGLVNLRDFACVLLLCGFVPSHFNDMCARPPLP